MEAAWYGRPEALQVLIDCGAAIEAIDTTVGRTALATAADKAADPKINAVGDDVGTGKGQRECVRLLIAAGANVHAQDQAGKTALHWAASQGNGVCCTMLLEAGADVQGTDTLFRRTALHYAAQNAQPTAYNALKKAGADEMVQDVRGNTPLDCTTSIVLQGVLQRNTGSMLDPIQDVPSWDEIHGVSIA